MGGENEDRAVGTEKHQVTHFKTPHEDVTIVSLTLPGSEHKVIA